MSTIDVANYSADDFVPRGIVNLMEGRRLPTAADAPWKVCLVGASLFPDAGGRLPDEAGYTTPLAPPNRPVRVGSERPSEDQKTGASAVELFGAGSELHLMCRAAFQAWPGVELWAAPVREPSWDEPDPSFARATAGLTLAGEALRVGEWTVVIHGTPVRARIEAGSDPEAALCAIGRALNARDDLPIRSVAFDDDGTCIDVAEGPAPGAWTLTLHARHRGANGDLIDVYRRGGTAGQSLTVRGFSGGDGANDLGSSKDTDPHGALMELAKDRYHYLAVANTDQENLDELKDHLERMASPIEGKRQQALFGWVGEIEGTGGAEELAAHLNAARMQCVWCRASAFPPGELAAAVAAHRAWMEGSFAAANTIGQVVAGLPRPRRPTDLPLEEELDEALHGGITPLAVKATGMAIVRSVTTRWKDDSGGESYALLDTIKVTVSDYVADDIALKLQARFGGFKLAPDTDVPVPARTATPATVRGSLLEWLRQYERAGMLRQVAEHVEEIRVEIDEDVPGRMNFELPEAVVDVCAVTAGNLIRF